MQNQTKYSHKMKKNLPRQISMPWKIENSKILYSIYCYCIIFLYFFKINVIIGEEIVIIRFSQNNRGTIRLKIYFFSI